MHLKSSIVLLDSGSRNMSAEFLFSGCLLNVHVTKCTICNSCIPNLVSWVMKYWHHSVSAAFQNHYVSMYRIKYTSVCICTHVCINRV